LASASAVQHAFADGMVFVPLAPISNPALALPTIAQALGVLEAGSGPLADRLHALLQEREFLLVLDNMEQILHAAPQIAALLGACPRLKVLVTSRVRLNVSGEQVFPVPPLALPDLHGKHGSPDVSASAAVRLFVTRARAVRPDFALTAANAGTVADICTRLDGLPLAIELAAARVALFRPPELLARLDRALPLLTEGAQDAPIRLRSMRDAIAWSYDLLTEDEQRLFRRLAVFVGGFTLAAAETVAADGLDQFDVIAAVGSLVERSLLRRMDDPSPATELDEELEPRFGMLETIREFGLEQLAAGGEEAAVTERHVAWCLCLAEQAERAYWGTEQGIWHARLRREIDNVRAALRWAEAHGDDQTILHLAGLLGIFWQMNGHAMEGARWLEGALARDQLTRTSARERALFAAGLMAWISGDRPLGVERCETSAELWQELGDTWNYALAINVLGMLRGETGDIEGGRRDLEESLRLYLELGDAWGIGLGYFDLGKLLTYAKAFDEAGDLIEQSLAYFRAVGDRWQITEALADLGGVAQARGEWRRVATLAAESLEIVRSQGWRWYLPESLELLAGVAVSVGHVKRGVQLLGAVEALREATGAARQPVFREPHARNMELARAKMSKEAFTVAWATGRTMELAHAIDEALDIAALMTRRPAGDGVQDPAQAMGLTQREAEVLRLVAAGQSDRQIGDRLFISARTVTTHTSNIYQKLGVHGRSEATAWAVKHGLV
jgi:predicted ATPase/DNA-binding CsgD family transcriptional regulator